MKSSLQPLLAFKPAFNTTVPYRGKRVTIKSADVYRIVNGMLVEQWDVVEASEFPNRKISEL